MVCIYCGHKTSVTNSRPQRRQQAVWRRRHCSECGATFTTQERADLSSSVAFINQKGRPEPFDRQKLFLSLYDSLRHRSHAQADATHLTTTVLSRLLTPAHAGSLSRHDVISAVTVVLKRFDRAAAVSYGAFHVVKY